MPARENYNPTQTVAPQGDAAPYENVQASPSAFGGAIGQAESGAGAELQHSGNQLMDVALHQQGMINDALSQSAETQYVGALGKLTGDYRSKEGLDAVSALPKMTQDISALRQQILQSIPNPAAQRAFNTLSQRHEAFALSDSNSYAAQQIKQASLVSSKASINTSIANAGSLNVAGDDKRFSDSLQDIDFHTRNLMQVQGYGSVMSEDPTTHALSFPGTPQGQQAKAVYGQQLQLATAKAWENRISSVAAVDLPKAIDIYQSNKPNIPPEAQFNLDRALTPKIKDYESRNIGLASVQGSVVARTNSINQSVQSAPPVGKSTNITDAIFQQESGNGATAPQNVAQIQPGTWAQYAQPGENIANPADNRAVGQRIINDLSKRFGNDPQRVAVGYFSGPGNVAPPNSQTPWINDLKDVNGKSVSSYVSDITARLNTPPGAAPTLADQYRTDFGKNIQDARAQAEQLRPGDVEFADKAAAHAEQAMREVITSDQAQKLAQQNASEKSMSDLTRRIYAGDPNVAQDILNPNSGLKSHEISGLMNLRQQEVEGKLRGDNALSKGYDPVLNRIIGSPDAPNHIYTNGQLLDEVNKGNINHTDFKAAQAELSRSADSTGFNVQKKAFYDSMKQSITREDPMLHIMRPGGDTDWLKALNVINKAFADNEASATPVPPHELLDPTNKNYIGKQLEPFQPNRKAAAAWELGDRVPVGVDPGVWGNVLKMGPSGAPAAIWGRYVSTLMANPDQNARDRFQVRTGADPAQVLKALGVQTEEHRNPKGPGVSELLPQEVGSLPSRLTGGL